MLLGSALLTIVTIISLAGVSSEDPSDDVSKFQKLFMQKRIEQLAAVKNILKLDDVKRKSLLDQITSKLFQVGRRRVMADLVSINATYSGFVVRSGGLGESRIRSRLHGFQSRTNHGESVSGAGEHLPRQ